MLYSSPQSISHHIANAGGALLVGLMFALVGLNLASGCGQRGGECIAVKDFIAGPAMDAHVVHGDRRAG